MKFKILIAALSITLFSGCVQLQELTRFTQCKFNYDSVKKVKLANINIDNVTNYNNLGFADIAKLVAGFTTGNLPLTFDVNIMAKNPNAQKASLSKLDWIAIIDDIEIATGAVNHAIEIPANNVPTKITLPVTVNLMEILKGQSQAKVLNFGMNLAGQGNGSSRVKVKIRPSIIVAGQTIQSPSYITLTKDL